MKSAVVSVMVHMVAGSGLVLPNSTVPSNGGDPPPNGNCVPSRTPDQHWTDTSVQCHSANCDSPQFYVVADGNKKMNVWTTNDGNAAWNAEGGYKWWKDYVTREIYDANMNKVLQSKQSCGGADKELNAWLTRAKEVHSCKYPAGDWEYVFGVDNPKATHMHSVSTSNGYTRGQSNSFTAGIKITESVGIEGVFQDSVELAFSATHTNSQTWSQSKTVTDTVTITAGKSVHVWQWKLTCMGFTDYGLFTEKLTFGTTLSTDTEHYQKPTCLPQDCDKLVVIPNQTLLMV